MPRGSGAEVVAKFGWEVKYLSESISAHLPIIAIRDRTQRAARGRGGRGFHSMAHADGPIVYESVEA